MWTRRQCLLGGAAAGAGLWWPRSGRAAVAPSDRKFVFVFVRGGWDTAMVFAPVFSEWVGRSATDEPATYGNLRLVANPARPITDGFFRRNHPNLAVIDGLLIRSVNHPICRNLLMTNSPSGSRPDWASTIGHASADRFVAPNMIVQGYSMAGDYSATSAISGTNGQLEQLLSPEWYLGNDDPQEPLPPETEALVGRHLIERARSRLAGATTPSASKQHTAFLEAASRLPEFSEVVRGFGLTGAVGFPGQIAQGVQFLSSGLSRCVTLMHPSVWDTHTGNEVQSVYYEDLFLQLGLLRTSLENTPGTHAPTLAEETVVVVFSEMGRAPFVNSANGKDHWMYTSVLMWGAGVRGDHQIGGHDDYLNGLLLDPTTDQVVSEGGLAITPDRLGATLLTLAGLDPVEWLGADGTLSSILA